MKRKMLTLTLTLLTLVLLTVSAAAAEYGVIYTEAEVLQSEELAQLGEYDLPHFTETYGIDLRVDVLTGMGSFSSLEELAPVIYDSYGYGCGEGGNGMTLSILVREDEDGVAMEEWYVYAEGESSELTSNGVWNVFPLLNELMTEENWSGGAEQDSETLAVAVRTMKDGLESFVLAGGVADSIWSPETLPDTSESFPAEGYITDTAGLLTAEERQMLDKTAGEIAESYGFGVYIITVEDFGEATGAYTVDDGAVALYQEYGMGLGEERKGVLLLLSMAGRDFSLVTYSDYGNYVFDAESREEIVSYFLDDFSVDNWYNGFTDYLSACELALYEGPDKLQSDINVKITSIFLIPLIIAAMVISVLNRKMKSVAKATEAEDYRDGDVEITQSYDRFTHSTETRHKRESESSDDDHSIHSSSSGGFGRTSGKF